MSIIIANGKRLTPRRVRFFGFNDGAVYISRNSYISSEMNVGFGTRINGRLIAKGKGKVSIGNYCAIGDGVRIITQNHSMDDELLSLQLQQRVYGEVKVKAADVKIGDNVWIGDSVIILPGIKIGSNSVIGAGTVVTRNVNDYDVIAGNPGKVINNRYKECFKLAPDDWKCSPMEIGAILSSEKQLDLK